MIMMIDAIIHLVIIIIIITRPAPNVFGMLIELFYIALPILLVNEEVINIQRGMKQNKLRVS